MKTLSSRAFNQDRSKAKQAADQGPVVITDRGEPAYVLMSFQVYQQLVAAGPSVGQALAMGQAADIEFEPERLALSFDTPTFD